MSKILIGKYEATIYPEGDGYTGAIDMGYDGAGRRQRIKRRGRTKAIVKDKLKEVADNLDQGIKTDKNSENYSVGDAVRDCSPKACEAAAPRPSRHLPSSPNSTSYRSSAPRSSEN